MDEIYSSVPYINSKSPHVLLLQRCKRDINASTFNWINGSGLRKMVWKHALMYKPGMSCQHTNKSQNAAIWTHNLLHKCVTKDGLVGNGAREKHKHVIMFNQGHRKPTRLKNSTALHCMCGFRAVLETQFTGAYKLSLQFLADILTTYTIYLASLLTFCLTWTTAFQKSLASTRWQSSHIWFWTTNSTTNTCCKMAPFNTCKDTVIRNPPWPASTAASRASRNAWEQLKSGSH